MTSGNEGAHWSGQGCWEEDLWEVGGWKAKEQSAKQAGASELPGQEPSRGCQPRASGPLPSETPVWGILWSF